MMLQPMFIVPQQQPALRMYNVLHHCGNTKAQSCITHTQCPSIAEIMHTPRHQGAGRSWSSLSVALLPRVSQHTGKMFTTGYRLQ